MYCQVCGDERTAQYRASKRQTLCNSCSADTPRKVGRAAFEARYWGAEVESVPHQTRRDFYEDYLRSECTLAQYCAVTID